MCSKQLVHNLSSPIQLRFKYELKKPDRDNSSAKNSGIIKRVIQKFRNFRSQSQQQLLNNQTKSKQQAVQIKFIELLANNSFIVGNCFKLQVIEINVPQNKTYIEANKLFQIYSQFSINKIIYEVKRSYLILCGEKIFQVYKMDLRSRTTTLQSQFKTNKSILFCEMYTDNTIIVFYSESCTIFTIETEQVVIRQNLEYQNKPKNLKLFSVPKIAEKYLNFFFYDQTQINGNRNDIFDLYKAQIYLQDSEFYMTPVIKIYQLKCSHLNNMKIINYNIQTILINLKYEIITLKRNYPIDSGKLNYWSEKSKLTYCENKTLLHIIQNKIEVYTFIVDDKILKIKSIDLMEIELQKMKGFTYYKAIPTQNNNFIIFFSSNISLNKNQCKYCFLVTTPQRIENKLKKMLFSLSKIKNFDQKLNVTDLKQIQEYATKLGLSKTQIFIELWSQSSKKSKQDYNLLLETESYKVISYEIKKRLKKSCIKFTEIQKIQRECLKMLEKQIKQEPTQQNIRSYLKCHMMNKKYKIHRILHSTKIKKRRNSQEIQQGYVSSRSQQLDERKGVYELSYQDNQLIRKQNIKQYILELLRNKTQDNLQILKEYINEFKIVLRVTFNQFIGEIITLFRQGFYDILFYYPEILPYYHEYFPGYPQYGGIWADLNNSDWQSNVYYEKIKNVDNISILNEMMKSDRFRWDFFIKHDFIKINKNNFVAQFSKYRSESVYYVVFNKLFEILGQKNESLKRIIFRIQQIYQIPSHLKNKVFLYWRLYNLLQRQHLIYGDDFSFEEFLKLKEYQIYQRIFNHEKNFKSMVLNQIRQIYYDTDNIFQHSIQQFFRSDLSKLSDLKYLINRINNYKMQQHMRNYELYRILLEGAYYKLRWQNNELLLNQITVYFTFIPLGNDQMQKLSQLETLEQYKEIFCDLNLNINLITFFENPQILIKLIVQRFMESWDQVTLVASNQKGFNLRDLIQFFQEFREKLHLNRLTDKVIISQIISFMMNYEQLIPSLQNLIYNECLLDFLQGQAENFLLNLIQEKIKQAFKVIPNFYEHENYIRLLLGLIRSQSPKKLQIQSHLNLGLMLQKLSEPVKAPLEYSSRFIQEILYNQKSSVLKTLDINQIYECMKNMGIKQKITNLYEIIISKFLKDGQFQAAVKYCRLWNQNETENIINYASLAIVMTIGEELSKEMRYTLVQIIISNYYSRRNLIKYSEQIMRIKQPNQRKLYINNIKKEIYPEQFYEKNWLLSLEFKQINYPYNSIRIKEYFQLSVRNIEREFRVNQNYHLYYRLLFTQPLTAYQYQKKKFELSEMDKIKTFYHQLLDCKLFNFSKLLLFFYKSIYFLFVSYFLAIEYQQLDHQFRIWTLEEMDAHQRDRIKKLSNIMRKSGELEKYEIIKSFRKLYIQSTKIDPNDYMSLIAQSDHEDQDFFPNMKPFRGHKKRVKKMNSVQRVPIKTKKSLLAVNFVGIQKKQSVQGQSKKQKNISKKASKFLNKLNSKKKNFEEQYNHSDSKQLSQSDVIQLKIQQQMSMFGRLSNLQRSWIRYFRSDQSPQNKIRSKKFEEDNLIQQNEELENIDIQTELKDDEKADKKSNTLKVSSLANLGGISLKQQTKQQQKLKFNKRSSNHSKFTIKEVQFEEQFQKPKFNSRGSNMAILRSTLVKKDSEIQGDETVKSLNNNNSNMRVSNLSSWRSRVNAFKQQCQKYSQQQENNNQKTQKRPDSKFNIIRSNLSTPKNNKFNLKQEDDDLIQEQKDDLQSNTKINTPHLQRKNEPKFKTVQFFSNYQEINKNQYKIEKKELVTNISESTDVNPIEIPVCLKVQNSQILKNFSMNVQNKYIINVNPSDAQIEIQNNQTKNLHTSATQQLSYTEDQKITIDTFIILIVQDKFDQLNLHYLSTQNQIRFLKVAVKQLYKKYNLVQFIKIVEKIIKKYESFRKIVNQQNFIILKNAAKLKINFDSRLIFPIEIIYVNFGDDIPIEKYHKQIFRFIKPQIREILSGENMFLVSKVVYLLLGYNKYYEWLIQFYYLQNMMTNYLKATLNADQIIMENQKICSVFLKFPISLIVERFEKIKTILQNHNKDKVKICNLIKIIFSMISEKKDSDTNSPNQIALIQETLNRIYVQNQ